MISDLRPAHHCIRLRTRAFPNSRRAVMHTHVRRRAQAFTRAVTRDAVVSRRRAQASTCGHPRCCGVTVESPGIHMRSPEMLWCHGGEPRIQHAVALDAVVSRRRAQASTLLAVPASRPRDQSASRVSPLVERNGLVFGLLSLRLRDSSAGARHYSGFHTHPCVSRLQGWCTPAPHTALHAQPAGRAVRHHIHRAAGQHSRPSRAPAAHRVCRLRG